MTTYFLIYTTVLTMLCTIIHSDENRIVYS